MVKKGDSLDPFAQGSPSATETGSIDFLKKNWDQIELFLEKRGRLEKLEEELRGYIVDVRSENASLKSIRFWTLILSILYVFFLNVLAICIIFFEQFKFFAWGEYTRTAFFILVFGTSGLIFLKLIIGSFKSREDRNKELDLPPSVALIVEAIKATGN